MRRLLIACTLGLCAAGLARPHHGIAQSSPTASPSRVTLEEDGGEVEVTLTSRDVEKFDGVRIRDAGGRDARGISGTLGRAARGRRTLVLTSRRANPGAYTVVLTAGRAVTEVRLDVGVIARKRSAPPSPPTPTLESLELEGGLGTVYPGQTLTLQYDLSSTPASPMALEITGSDPGTTPGLPATVTVTSSSGSIPLAIGDFDGPGSFTVTATLDGSAHSLTVERAFAYLDGMEVLDAPGGVPLTTAVGNSEVWCSPIVKLTAPSFRDVEVTVGLEAVAGGAVRMQGQTHIVIPAGQTQARGSEPCQVPSFTSPSVDVAYHAFYRELSRTAILGSTPDAPPLTEVIAGMNDRPLWPGDTLEARFVFGAGDALDREALLQYSDPGLLVDAPSVLEWSAGIDSRFLFEIAPYDFDPAPLEITMTGGQGSTVTLSRQIAALPQLVSAAVTLGHGGPTSGPGPAQLVCLVTLGVESSPRRTFYDRARFSSSRPDLLSFYDSQIGSDVAEIDALVSIRRDDGAQSSSGTNCRLLQAVDEDTPVDVTVTYRGQSVVATFMILAS